MRVCVIGEPWVVPPHYYGGADRLCDLLCKGLAKRGHVVNLLAGRGSKVYSGKTLTYKRPTLSYNSRLYHRAEFNIKAALCSHNADIVHSFKFWPEYHQWCNRLDVPVIYCQQNTARENDLERILRCNKAHGHMHAISEFQAKRVRRRDYSRLSIIHNATDTNRIRPVKHPRRSYLAYLGRLNYDKGVDIAVQVSVRTGIPLKIAGVLRPSEPEAHRLFEETVQPYLGELIQFIGAIDDDAKSEFLGNALALLIPNRWAEPFGIVMAESLSAGTPVLGTPTGAIPEIIESGKTGLLGEGIDELCSLAWQVSNIDASVCRQSAIDRFSEYAFIGSVLKMYTYAKRYEDSSNC